MYDSFQNLSTTASWIFILSRSPEIPNFLIVSLVFCVVLSWLSFCYLSFSAMIVYFSWDFLVPFGIFRFALFNAMLDWRCELSVLINVQYANISTTAYKKNRYCYNMWNIANKNVMRRIRSGLFKCLLCLITSLIGCIYSPFVK